MKKRRCFYLSASAYDKLKEIQMANGHYSMDVIVEALINTHRGEHAEALSMESGKIIARYLEGEYDGS